ncbi:MAG: hypothetical protein PHD41_01190 [Methanosarcinaceae archaeon]|nr:hypothetical protein [Methanosarcinaceae archaeon]MDD4331895.1 hypothetical protein [Methanosarcinaceae archaeon]MDD4749248.1 hypothetical protein [Methanosarcinaceae archaeon]
MLILGIYFFSVFKLYGFSLESGEQHIIAFLLLIYGFAMWGLYGMKFQLGGKRVLVRFPPFNYGIEYSKISSVEILDRVPWYTGWGLRIHWRTLLFVGKHTRAVRITKKEGFFREVILVPEHVEEFSEKLRIALGK